jgi:hypothetical protein
MLPSRGVRVWVVYLTPKIERIIVLLSASLEGEARLPMPKGMAYKGLLLLSLEILKEMRCGWLPLCER